MSASRSRKGMNELMSEGHRNRLLVVLATTIVGLLSGAPAFSQAIPQKNINVIGPTPVLWLLAGNPRMQQNEPECAVSPNYPAWQFCGFNDYRAVNIPGIGDAFPGVAMSRDWGRTWISGLHPYNLLDNPTINQKFGADANVEAMPNFLLYNFIAGWRDDSNPGGVYVSRWYEHNREVGPPWEILDVIEVDTGTSGRFLDKPAFDAAMYPPGSLPPIEIPIPAFDDPRNASNSHTAYTLQVPAFRAHLCYAIFVGNDNNNGTKINCLASDDGGLTWPVNSKITEGVEINQGVSLATRNDGQDVLAVWRRFHDNNETSAIMYALSTDFGSTWSKAKLLTEFCAFDQGTGAARFRTNALPVAVSNGSDFAVYFASRNNATETCFTIPGGKDKTPVPNMSPVAAEHDFDGPQDGMVRTVFNFSRIMMVRSTGGNNLGWSPPEMVDPQTIDGSSNPNAARKPFHQFMPAAEAAGGIETISWYDSRLDRLNNLSNPIVGGFVEDVILNLVPNGMGGSSGTLIPAGIYGLVPPPPQLPPANDNFPLRRNIDTFAAQIVNGSVRPYTVDANFYAKPIGVPSNSVRVSRFATRFKLGAPGNREQVEFNFPNGRLFRKGTAPFIGDYNTVFAPQFRELQDGNWKSNLGPFDLSPGSQEIFSSSEPIFNVGWTSNRNVRGRVFYTGCDVWDEPLQMWIASPEGCASSYEDPTALPEPPGQMMPLQGEDGSSNGPPPVCQPGGPHSGQPLTRNQNIFVAAMKPGINVDIVSAIKLPDGTGFNTFVLEILNGTPVGRRVRLEIPHIVLPDTTVDQTVSFDKDGPLTEIVVDVPRGSGNVRTIFDRANILADDPPPPDKVIVEVFDVTGLPPAQAVVRGEGEKIARVALERNSLAPLENVQNNDPDYVFNITNPEQGEWYDIILNREIGTTQSLDLSGLDFENTIYMLDLDNLDIDSLDLDNLDLDNKDLENAVLFLDLDNLDLDNLDLDNTDLKNALYEQLDLDNLDLDNLDLDNLDLDNLDLDNRNLFYLDLEALDLDNAVYAQLDLDNLDLDNLDLDNLDLDNLDLDNFSVYASDIENLDLDNLDLDNSAPGDNYTEISWTADSATNTITGVDVKPVFTQTLADAIEQTTLDGDPTNDTKVLLTIRKPYLTSTVLTNEQGASPGLYCTPQVVAENQLVYAAILDASQINAIIDDPGPTEAITPSFVQSPDGSHIITVRYINPPPGFDTQAIHWNSGMVLYSQPGDNATCEPETVGNIDLLDCEFDFITDTTAPVITLNGASPLILEAGPGAYDDPGALAADDFDGAVTPAITFNDVVPSVPGDYSVTYTAADTAGNESTATRIVNVVDTTDPLITAPADVQVEASGAFTAVDIGTASASDIVGPLNVVNDAPASFALGPTIVTWTATDGAGNSSSDMQTITVVDTTGPQIVLEGSNPLPLEASNEAYTDPGATAFDLVSGIIVPVITFNDVDPAVAGNYSVEYTATDGAGNSTVATRTVNVQDTVPPDIVGDFPPPPFEEPPVPLLSLNGTNLQVMWPISADDLEAELTISCSIEGEIDPILPASTSYDSSTGILTATFDYVFPVGETDVSCMVTDQGGLSDSTATFTAFIEDTPELIVNQPILTVPTDGGSVATVYESDLIANLTVDDTIDNEFPDDDRVTDVSCLGVESQEFAIGEHEIQCTATDSSGNPAEPVVFTIRIVFPFEVVILEPKGNVETGSSLPIDFYYVDPNSQPPGQRIDSSMLSVSASWIGPYADRNCTDDTGPNFGMGNGSATGGSGFRYSAPKNEWQFNWSTEQWPGCYLFTIQPPGGIDATIQVNLK